MNKEILEITKKFHDTYEKLASEYTYETREDTKVFDINSSNGKLMYATVNEVIKPILEENKKQKEVIDKAIELLGNYKHYSIPDEKQNGDNEDLVNNAFDILKEVKTC